MIHEYPYCFFGKVIDHGQELEFTTGQEPVVHKINRPDLIWLRSLGTRNFGHSTAFFALTMPDLQLLLCVNPSCALAVDHQPVFLKA